MYCTVPDRRSVRSRRTNLEHTVETNKSVHSRLVFYLHPPMTVGALLGICCSLNYSQDQVELIFENFDIFGKKLSYYKMYMKFQLIQNAIIHSSCCLYNKRTTKGTVDFKSFY